MNNEDLGVFWDRAILSGVEGQWSEGVGLISPRARYALMAKLTVKKCDLFLGQGMTLNEAIDEALGLGPSLRGDLTRAIEEGLTKAAPTLSDLT